MPPVSVSNIATFVLNLAAAESDAVLLNRFVESRDEDAFAVIVGRYGSLVRGSCCRILGDVAAVDDVVQTTFIVLARNAGTIRRRNSLASWLHATTQRSALHYRQKEVCL